MLVVFFTDLGKGMFFFLACSTTLDKEEETTRLSGETIIMATVSLDYSVGALSAYTIEDNVLRDSISSVSGDPALSMIGDSLWLLNRYQYDTIRSYEPEHLESPIWEQSVAPESGSANPHEAVLCGGKAFVSQYELSFLLILDQYTGDQVGTVDISSFGDSDGRTESSSLVCFEERLYVGLEGLNRDLGFSYSESSIISIDPILEEVVSNWNIGNGIQMIADPFREGLLVSSAEWEGYPAGVYRFFPEDGDWEPISTLGQTPSRMAGDNNRLVYIAPSEGYEQYQVFCHDWEASETVEGDYFSEFLTDIQLDSTGIAWIGAHWGWNDIENAEAGLHRIDSSCQRGEHISTLLAPFRFVLATLPEESL